MKTVTDPQIDRLFEFTKQHYVEWYDVQIELVDHLANGIENQWKEAPDIPFEKALNIEFKKFGILYSINQKKQIKTRFIKTQKKWLIDNEFMQLGGLIHVLNLIFSFQGLYHTDMHWTLFSELLLSIGLVVFVLLFYVSMKIIPVKLKAKIAQEHPEYNFS